MIQTRTFEYRCNKEELEVLAAALDAMKDRRYDDAVRILIARRDAITADYTTKLYDQRDA